MDKSRFKNHLNKLINDSQKTAQDTLNKLNVLENFNEEDITNISKNIFELANDCRTQAKNLETLFYALICWKNPPTWDSLDSVAICNQEINKDAVNKFDSDIDIKDQRPSDICIKDNIIENDLVKYQSFEENALEKKDAFLKCIGLQKQEQNENSDDCDLNQLVDVTYRDFDADNSSHDSENSDDHQKKFNNEKFEKALNLLISSDEEYDHSDSDKISSESDISRIEKELCQSSSDNSLHSLEDGKNEESVSKPDDFKIKQCYVKLTKLNDVPTCISSSADSTDATRSDNDIDRMCNLKNIENVSKSKKDLQEKKLKKRKKKRMIDSSTDSDSSASENLLENVPDSTNPFGDVGKSNFNPELDFLSSDDEYQTDSDTENKLNKKKIKKEGADNDLDKKSNVSDKKNNWRNDKLLRENFDTTDDETCSDSSKTFRRKRRKETSSDSELENFNRKKIFKSIFGTDSETSELKISKQITLNSDSSTAEDNDPSFIPSDDTTTSLDDVIKIENDSDIENGTEQSEKGTGRKNIRPVLSSKDLTEETQKAAREEEERVKRLEERQKLKSSSQEMMSNRNDGFILDVSENGETVSIDPVLSKKLFKHQISGVQFMWEACYESLDIIPKSAGSGCILAHCMGLGKTFQVVTLVLTLFKYPSTNTKRVIIVCPVTTLEGWRKEFRWGLKNLEEKVYFDLHILKSSLPLSQKIQMIENSLKKRTVLILGYEAFGLLPKNPKLSAEKLKVVKSVLLDPGPDLIICDEGHLLKSGSTLKTKTLMQVKTRRRIVLTGTPLQNNLNEYYHMVQFVKPNLLGTLKEYSRQFSNPIQNGQYEDSNEGDIKLMKKRTHVLHRLLKDTVQRFESEELSKYLKDMKDYVLFIQLHPIQEDLYKRYLEYASKRKTMDCEKNAMDCVFYDFAVFKHICSHPKLLDIKDKSYNKPIKEIETITKEPDVEMDKSLKVPKMPTGWWKEICPPEIHTEVELGTKFQVMLNIIQEAEACGEKVLIFTSSLVELNGIEHFLKVQGTEKCPSWQPNRDYFRMDGTVKPNVRAEMCDIFNDEKNKKMRVFLMSHKVGGLGLNLVAANRVILLGANFNPSNDEQSIYRAYRFGQEKCVYIYRLIAMGTMEEKIYNRCVTKLAIARRVVDKHQITRHYKNLDLVDLYTEQINSSQERGPLRMPEDVLLAKVLMNMKCIFKYHEHEALLQNRPDEELNEEDQKKAWEEFKTEKENETRLKLAQEMVSINANSSGGNFTNKLNITELHNFAIEKIQEKLNEINVQKGIPVAKEPTSQLPIDLTTKGANEIINGKVSENTPTNSSTNENTNRNANQINNIQIEILDSPPRPSKSSTINREVEINALKIGHRLQKNLLISKNFIRKTSSDDFRPTPVKTGKSVLQSNVQQNKASSKNLQSNDVIEIN